MTNTITELTEAERHIEKTIQEKQQLLDSIRRTREYLSFGTIESPNGALMPNTVIQEHRENHTAIVLAAIEAMKRKYTLRDVRASIAESGKKLSNEQVNEVLRRLRERGEIIPLRKGKGRRPTIYKKPFYLDNSKPTQHTAA